MSSEPVKSCPKCGGDVKKLISAGAGAIFKGSGFYQTDYKNKQVKSKKTGSKDPAPVKPEKKPDSTPKSE
jgi:predicted nucleic acid-binding Zn ribbon protein